MDLPNEIVEAVAADAPPPRATRSAQRRRAAAAASSAPDVAPEPLPEPAAESATRPSEAEPAGPPLSNPPAAVKADTIIAEDHVMDTVNTAETVVDQTRAAAEQMTDRGQAAFADMGGRAKEALEKGSRMVEELGTFGKGNVEALVESSRIAAKGFETLGQEAADFTRKSFESATAAMKTLAATRSPTEFMKLQGDYARQMFDAMVAESSKSTEMMLKLASDVAQPLSNRVAVAAEKMKIAA